MAEKEQKPDSLRLAAAAILGIIVGALLFFVVAIVIGIFNDVYGMNLPVSTDVAENIWSLILLIVFVVLGIAGFCWKVWTTPPTPEESGIPESGK